MAHIRSNLIINLPKKNIERFYNGILIDIYRLFLYVFEIHLRQTNTLAMRRHRETLLVITRGMNVN